MYTNPFYRKQVRAEGLTRFQISLRESDLLVLCDSDLSETAAAELQRAREGLESWIERDPVFKSTLLPHAVDATAPPVVQNMAAATQRWNIGPMGAVAGALAETVGKRLENESQTVVVENGGDTYAKSSQPLRFGLYAGEASPFSNRIAFEVDTSAGIGVCTSSGTVGPSLSFGRADAVVAIARDTAEADAAATALANRIKTPADIEEVLEDEKAHKALVGLIACAGDRIGFWGEVTLHKS